MVERRLSDGPHFVDQRPDHGPNQVMRADDLEVGRFYIYHEATRADGLRVDSPRRLLYIGHDTTVQGKYFEQEKFWDEEANDPVRIDQVSLGLSVNSSGRWVNHNWLQKTEESDVFVKTVTSQIKDMEISLGIKINTLDVD